MTLFEIKMKRVIFCEKIIVWGFYFYIIQIYHYSEKYKRFDWLREGLVGSNIQKLVFLYVFKWAQGVQIKMVLITFNQRIQIKIVRLEHVGSLFC